MKYADLQPGALFYWPGHANNKEGNLQRKISDFSWENVNGPYVGHVYKAECSKGYFNVIEVTES